MTSVEKRRSGRKSGGHRKHSDGGYSDTSSAGSFLDETDREVSNLTDRAFRSLCIGDEAVYNDSDLCSSSPCIQRDRQLAFSHSDLDRDREDREREELKRAAHESFSLRVQQYGQDWIHGGMHGAKIHRDPQWEVYGERTQERVSATFQHSFMETSQQGESLREEQLSFLSNGATELQQRRSRSRVSSLIRAFNSEGHKDGAVTDGKLREWNDETSWDKSALMSIQRELSEFSTSYQPNFNSGHFPPAGPFSSQDTNYYSSAVANMNSSSSFMRSSHSKHSMSAQVNCNSNFFIHSEFSPFKVWRDHNRFPFQQGEVSGFMHCSEFPKWYETPMYKELSPQVPYRFDERGIRHPRNNMAPVVPATPSRSTSTSTMLQRALSVEKRCESELAGHYPHRKRTQSLGANRLPSQRPSTASPTSEMSRRVQDTITSVKALQQKIKMMTEQNISTGVTMNQQGVLCSHDNSIPFGNHAQPVAPNVVSSNTSTTPFSISHLLTPLVHTHQDAETSEARQYAVSPQPVEHAPVRAESRGATPDVRMSSYKSRATSLLFNLKDNRKRVKSTYSPPKFKGLETSEKSKQLSLQEPKDTVIDIPEFPDSEIQYPYIDESSRTNAASHQYVNQYHNPGLPLATLNSQPATTYTGQYSEYTSSDYQAAQMQGEMVHHSGFSGFIPENYPNNQLANGQYLHEDLSSFTPYKQGMIDAVETPGGDAYRLKPSYTAAEMPRLNADNNQTRGYLLSTANTGQHFNETAGKEFTKEDRYQQLKDSKHDYSNVSSQDRWRQKNSQDSENLGLKTAIAPWKQEITALMEKEQHAQAYQRAGMITEEMNLPRDKYKKENQQSINKELEKIEQRESFGVGTFSHKKAELVNPNISNQLLQYAPFSNDTVEHPVYYGQHQPGSFTDNYGLQNYSGHDKANEMTQNYNRYTDQEYRNQHNFNSNKDKTMFMQETGQGKAIPKEQSLQKIEAKPQFEQNLQKNSLSNPDTMANQTEHTQFVEVKAEQATAEHIKAQHAQAELAKAQHWAQVEQPKVESARLILAGQTGSEKVNAEEAKVEVAEHRRVNQANEQHIKDKKTEEEKAEPPTDKQLEQAREEQTKVEQTRVETVTEKPKNITEEAGAKHIREVQGDQVKAAQAEEERLKEEHIKNVLAKTEQAEQARIKQAKTEQARRERIKAEQLEEEKLRAEQVEREQMEAEQIRTEKVKAEQAEAEHGKAEQAKLEQMKEQQAKAEQGKTKEAENLSIQGVQMNAGQPSTQISNAKEENVELRKVEKVNLEQTRLELAKAEVTKTENVQERFAKPLAKLTMTQLVKSEPDKVEQVKTELAKAKAELAKIKEKMRGEQKDKVKSTTITKEDEIKKDALLKVDANQNEERKDPAKEKHQQKEESVVNRPSTNLVNRGGEEYERLREKYGFIDNIPTNRNKLSAAGTHSSSDANETSALSLDKHATTNDEKPKDKPNPASTFATTNTEDKEKRGSFKSSEVTESHYVYSESSKEFKLSAADYLPTNGDRPTGDTATDKVKVDSAEKMGKCDPLKQTDVSQQRDLAKPPATERKPKSAEHSAGPVKDSHFNPPRQLTNKERAQTKQEILTSKIKAHAEKEISAIKEKGFALRDGFMSKTSAKQLAGSQNINIRQRPPSQEVPKKHESTISSNTTPKHHTEPVGIQKEPVKFVSPPSSAVIPVKSAASTSQSVDHSQKQVPKIPTKSSGNEPKQLKEEKQTGGYTMSTDEGFVENQKKENQSGIRSKMQSKEQTVKNKQEKQEPNHGERPGKQNERLKDNPAVNVDHLNKKKEDPSLATALVKAESCKPTMAEKNDSKHKVEDLAPSLNLCIGQNETLVADDSLQIMGIMVTVRERQPSESNDQWSNSSQEQINAKEKECSNSELDKCHCSSGLEVSEGNKSNKEDNRVKAEDRVTQNTEKEDQTKVNQDNHPENVQETLTPEKRGNNVPEDVTVKKTNLQQMSSSTNTRSQRETQLPEPLAEKGVPSTVTVPAKNKAETQAPFYKQDTIARETKDYTNKMAKEKSAKSTSKDEVRGNKEEKNPLKIQTVPTNENTVGKVVNAGINPMNESNRAHGETVIKDDSKPSMKEDMTTVINSSKSKSIDGKNAPLVEEKRNDATLSKPFNKASPSNHSNKDENIHKSPQNQYKETHTGENSETDDNVHIGSIAIKVVPAVTEQNKLKMMDKLNVTSVPSDEVAANEHELLASTTHVEKVKTLNNEDRTKNIGPVHSEEKMKDSSNDKLETQQLLSSENKLPDSLKISNHQNSMNATSQNNQAEIGKPEKVHKSGKSVDDSKMQPMERDYFQVQGATATKNEPHNKANIGQTSDAVSKGRELPGSLPNKSAISNGSYREGKNEVSILDQSKMKTVESSTGSVKDENMKRKNKETVDNLASKQSNGPTERQSNKNEKMEAGQAIHIRKQHTENQPSLSARERQSSKNSKPTGENTAKPEDKPKPKDRASTIPEISAIADYARLKVIVSEERANEIQEFPPNKKEGFFPLIQTRHSRRPVFTADPQDLAVKEKSLPNKTEVSSKVNKEQKPIVFPITEKEHQRTGMFKLGDKERQEKILSDVKTNEDLKERNKSPTTHLKNQGSEEQLAGNDTQRRLQVDQSLHQANHLSQATTSSLVSQPGNTSMSKHLKSMDNRKPYEKHEACSSKAGGIPYLDQNSPPQSTPGQIYNVEESKQITVRRDQKNEKAHVMTGEDRPEKQERYETRHEETGEKQNRAKQLEEEQASRREVDKRAEDTKIKHMIEEHRASLAEEEKKAAQREEERRAREREAIALKIKERREKQREAERRAEEERKAKQMEEEIAAQKEEELKAKQREEERKMEEIEEKKRKMEEERRLKLREEEERVIKMEEMRRVKQQEEVRAAQEAQQKRAAQEELQKRAAEEEQQRRAAQEEQQKRAAQEEQQRRAAQEELQRKVAQEEQQRRAAQEEQQRRAAQEEQQMRAAQEEQQRKVAREEQQRRAAQEEQQRRAAQEEQQKRAAQEEQQRRAAQEEQQKRAAQEEQQRRAAQEEQQRRVAQKEEQRRAELIEEQQRRAVQEEQQRKAAQELQQKRAALIEEQQRRAAKEVERRRAAQEEQQKRAALIEEQQRRTAEEEQQKRAAQEEQQRRAALIEEQRQRTAEEQQQKRAAQEEQQRKAAQEEQQRAAHEEHQQRAALFEKQRQAKQVKEKIEEERAAQISKEDKSKQTQQQKKREHLSAEQTGDGQKREECMKTRGFEENQTALKEEKRVAQEQALAQKEDEIMAKKREEEKLSAYREKERLAQMEEQKRTAQRTDALQYYAITSTESEKKSRERQLCSPLPSHKRNNPQGLESTEDYQSRSYRPHAPASPAPSLPRSNTSSPALGVKPSMFRVKDNTTRGSSFTKSIKPRFHRNFGEDFRVGSPMGSERGEEEHETIRRSAVTPVHPDTGLNRLAAIKESSTFQPGSSLHDYSAPLQHHRPYSRRSFALDEDDSRSVISNMSEDVESFATSGADLAELRGLYDYDRPESACSFSSDVSRSLGKPPAVPPKSEKALRRAKRLTTRRIKKELSKGVADSPAVENPPQEASSITSSSSTEVRPLSRHAVASPHFSPPVSLAHAPPSGPSLPSSPTESSYSHSSFYASPHATGPISCPVASPHATAPVSLPVASPLATGPASHSGAPKIVADVPSSPILHHAKHPAPVTQYHLESSYPQSYPLTQRKVLQDLGSGQYFVVDVPVPVKTKTFFDPETGKYVQLNVRESGKSTSQPQPQQTYLQPQVQPQIHVNSQQPPPSQNSQAGKSHVLYQGYHGYPQSYQPAAVNSTLHNRSSAPATLHQDQQPVRESHSYGYPAPEIGENSEGHRYSPEKTPYMDTVNDKDKTCNRVYNTHDPYECDTNSQLADSSVCENDNSAHSQYQSRNIITMSELEDFMEVSDW